MAKTNWRVQAQLAKMLLAQKRKNKKEKLASQPAPTRVEPPRRRIIIPALPPLL
jgi:hypothetical protein